MNTTVTLIAGDGIGPEIVDAVKEIFSAAGAPVEWEEENAGQTTLDSQGELIPKTLLQSLERTKIGLKGPITTPVGRGFKSVNIQLRQYFDLYANVRPAKNIPGVATRFENVDIVLFRENTEGLYAGLEFYDDRLKITDTIARITDEGCERIVRAAFEYAVKNDRKKVTVVHKANVLKMAGAALLRAAKSVAADYPQIQMDDIIIDNMCMQLVVRPERFDILVTTNLFGDIISDLCAGLVGGLGVVPGANIGKDVAIFEAVHGTAPDIAGKGIANPTALLKSAIMMLEYMGEKAIAAKIENALHTTLTQPELRTGDLGGKASTAQFTESVISNL
ncbi:isocitrate/isopropylmalate dehydrogenase family protein [Aridibaculum aurantiacum]|uniref:isocitrate/isopropylmalate dehydrogenase family protein n=1 Tax=Aridibaculum aurantiacum TaxID=2810307 RepID=UPI001A95FED4|nr:isocitrate/isopropylmalate family dehydrogenase [Aridibaculum aurantiacum]